jgi:hypothetical protein
MAMVSIKCETPAFLAFSKREPARTQTCTATRPVPRVSLITPRTPFGSVETEIVAGSKSNASPGARGLAGAGFTEAGAAGVATGAGATRGLGVVGFFDADGFAGVAALGDVLFAAGRGAVLLEGCGEAGACDGLGVAFGVGAAGAATEKEGATHVIDTYAARATKREDG